MKKRVIAALAAVVLAVVSVGLLIGYAHDANQRAFNNAKLHSVLQVKESIPAGTPADKLGGRVEVVKLPQSAIAKGAIADLAEVRGMSTTTALEPGEEVLLTRFAKEGVSVGEARGAFVPKGDQEVTIALTAERAVGGVLKVGNTVGVVSSVLLASGDGVTQVIVNRAIITKVSTAVVSGSGSESGAGFLVTLAVTTRQAGLIVNTAEYGKLYLTKQYPDTTGGEGGLVSKVKLGSGK